MMNEVMCPRTIKDCFIMDEHELNPTPKNLFSKIYVLMISSRYSMPVYMRLSQYFYKRRENSTFFISRKFFALLQSYFTRKNQINNNFEVSPNCMIMGGGGSFSSFRGLHYNKYCH